MSAALIHGKARLLSASRIREALGDDVSRIRIEDGLTWADMGRVLGKSEDQVAKYADASAEMSVTTYVFGKAQWNGRFTGSVDRLVDDARPDTSCDQSKQSRVLKAALALSVALEDGEIDANEVRANRQALEGARDAIEDILRKLAPRSASL